MKRDEQQVADLISHLQEKMINPFDIQQHPAELIDVRYFNRTIKTSKLTYRQSRTNKCFDYSITRID
jgi:hypothetical protein